MYCHHFDGASPHLPRLRAGGRAGGRADGALRPARRRGRQPGRFSRECPDGKGNYRPGPGGSWGAEGRCARRPAQRRPASRPGLAGRPPAAPRGAGCVASPERIASLFRTISYSLLRRGSILYVGARAWLSGRPRAAGAWPRATNRCRHRATAARARARAPAAATAAAPVPGAPPPPAARVLPQPPRGGAPR